MRPARWCGPRLLATAEIGNRQAQLGSGRFENVGIDEILNGPLGIKELDVAAAGGVEQVFNHAAKRSDADSPGDKSQLEAVVGRQYEIAANLAGLDVAAAGQFLQGALVAAARGGEFHTDAEISFSGRGGQCEEPPVAARIYLSVRQSPLHILTGQVNGELRRCENIIGGTRGKCVWNR